MPLRGNTPKNGAPFRKNSTHSGSTWPVTMARCSSNNPFTPSLTCIHRQQNIPARQHTTKPTKADLSNSGVTALKPLVSSPRAAHQFCCFLQGHQHCFTFRHDLLCIPCCQPRKHFLNYSVQRTLCCKGVHPANCFTSIIQFALIIC